MENITDNDTFSCLAFGNLSATDISNKSHWQIVDELRIASSVLAAFYILFFLIAFFWNLFIVITYLTKYKLLKQPGNLFLFNLALADLLIAVTTMMFSFVAQAASEFVFGFTDIVRCSMCNLAGVCFVLFTFLGFHLLAALSVDRFILLTRPLRYKKIMTFWRAIIIIAVIWIISLVISILPFAGLGEVDFNQQFGSCIPRFTGTNLASGILNFYYVVLGVAEALIPIIIIVVTNVFTYRLVSKFLKRNITRRRTFRNPAELQANSDEERRHRHQQQQLVRVFGALCIANCVAWTPVILVVVVIVILGAIVAGEIPNGIYVFGWICYLSNPVVHPIIESFFVKDLRYQVNRAQRTIRRASSAFVRTTTKIFGESDLDKANAAMDAGNTPPPSRQIKFFNREKARERFKTNPNSSMDTTEMELTTTTPSPTPEVPKREVKKMSKVGRSVTFTETPSPPSSLNGEGGVVLKSVLKRASDPLPPTAIQLHSLTEAITEIDEQDVDNEDEVFQQENGMGLLSHEQAGNGIVLHGDESSHNENRSVSNEPPVQLPSNNTAPIVEQPVSGLPLDNELELDAQKGTLV